MPRKVLIVDDSLTVRQQVAVVLWQAGYVVLEASNGREALASLAANADTGLVLCDIHMPVMSGLEFLAAIAAEGTKPSVPILFLTSEAHPEVITRAKRLGALGWLLKPIKSELLLKTVQRFVPLASAA